MIATRFKLIVAYHGASFCGFQKQLKLNTIQSELQRVLKQLTGEEIAVVPEGRTDAGVHALAQLTHFDVKSPKAVERITKQDIIYKMNCLLPDSILVLDVKKVSSKFHARKAAEKKEYGYHILFSPYHNPFIEDLVWRIHKPLDEAAMKKAAQHLVGMHDFTSFCASDATDPFPTKTLHAIRFSHTKIAPRLSFKHEEYLTIQFIGSGFLKQMVRNLTGTLVAVGQKKIAPSDVKTILAAKDRTKAYQTAPAKGLMQVGVQHAGPTF